MKGREKKVTFHILDSQQSKTHGHSSGHIHSDGGNGLAHTNYGTAFHTSTH